MIALLLLLLWIVEIHKVCWGNEWMGSSDLNTLNKDEQVDQLARASKQNKQRQQQVAKQNKVSKGH